MRLESPFLQEEDLVFDDDTSSDIEVSEDDGIVYESSDEEEEEEDLPDPVDVDTPFHFARIVDRLERTLELDHGIGCDMELSDDDNTMFPSVAPPSTPVVTYVIELRARNSGLRKLIFSSGDITYRRRSWVCNDVEDRLVDVFWDGTEVGVCESCQDVSGLHHPIYYRASERMYPEMYYGEDKVLASLPNYAWSYLRQNANYELKCLRPLTVFMRHNTLPIALGDAVRRQEQRAHLLMDLEDKGVAFLTDTLASHHMDMPNSVKHMNKKAQVMRELFHTCICGQNTREARVWTYKRQYGPPLHTITPVHVVSEQAILERFAEEIREDSMNPVLFQHDQPLTSEVRHVHQPCACLCACGHRNTNYVRK